VYDDDGMDVIGHDDECITFDVGEPLGYGLPRGEHHLSGIVQHHFVVCHLTK